MLQRSSAYFLVLLFFCNTFLSNCSSSQKTKSPPEVSNKEVNVVTETKPAIVGGMEALYSNLTYPQKALEEGIETKLNANVLVNKNGKIDKISFDKETDYGFQEAAEEALHRVQFVAGKRNEEAIDTYITIPIKFSLE